MDKKAREPGNADPPLGEKFSQVYLPRGEPAADSVRMRRRLSALIYDTRGLDEFRRELEKELGVDVSASGWHLFLQACELRDVLDGITIAYRFLLRQERRDRHGLVKPEDWLRTVRRIFVEECLHYTVDKGGGVHFSFDAEFESNRVSTISALGAPRYSNARREFQGVDTSLSETPPNGKGAIRSTFTTAEVSSV